MKKNTVCQSCGMPLKYDPENGGSEQNGTKSELYCSYCYQNGKFTNEEIKTPLEMQKFCITKMKEQGMPGFVAWIFTRGIHSLKRWK